MVCVCGCRLHGGDVKPEVHVTVTGKCIIDMLEYAVWFHIPGIELATARRFPKVIWFSPPSRLAIAMAHRLTSSSPWCVRSHTCSLLWNHTQPSRTSVGAASQGYRGGWYPRMWSRAPGNSGYTRLMGKTWTKCFGALHSRVGEIVPTTRPSTPITISSGIK